MASCVTLNFFLAKYPKPHAPYNNCNNFRVWSIPMLYEIPVESKILNSSSGKHTAIQICLRFPDLTATLKLHHVQGSQNTPRKKQVTRDTNTVSLG
ncbi:hypothetical protein BELL_0215g00110 [Botrytis elliptica]|uniref:Uncharacterized protein n=1 Tax=Botrytis elliptica TaxID=278938 RepID=A0A4Z1K1Z2_9HELO|nr:hypothetical protein BELL_0215g00110 [Botrytis elliptica]